MLLFHGRGENVLLFLVQTVGRQQIEQRQYTSRRRSTVVRKSSAQQDPSEPTMPDHDLDPPKFAKKALERILNDWTAVMAMLMTGYSSSQDDSR